MKDFSPFYRGKSIERIPCNPLIFLMLTQGISPGPELAPVEDWNQAPALSTAPYCPASSVKEAPLYIFKFYYSQSIIVAKQTQLESPYNRTEQI